MINRRIFAALSAVALMGSVAQAQTLPTHRIPAALAVEAASETVAACAKQGYHETAQVVDADGVVIATLRGDVAGARAQAVVDRVVELGAEAQVDEDSGGAEDERHHRREDEGDAKPDRDAAQRPPSLRSR